MPIKVAFVFVAILIATARPAFAVGQVNSGDTAWMLMSTALVLMMVIPGLAMFYSGLVRTKNTLSMLSQVFSTVCVVALLWIVAGYSLVYSGGALSSFIGGSSKVMLRSVTIDSVISTGMIGADIPEFAFIAFQMMFACIAPAIIVGAFAERMRYAALLLFVLLWTTFAYLPLAHMTWFAADPDAIAEAARAVAHATSSAARQVAELSLQETLKSAGLFRQWGALDFAGGAPIHVSAGIAGLVGAMVIGHRAGYGRVSMAPHNLAFTIIGGALLWIGWLGFNGGSALRANGVAALAIVNTFAAAAAAAVSWTAAEWVMRDKPSTLGMISGAMAGLVAITPGCGYAGPGGAVILGVMVGAPCFWFSTSFKARWRFDDALDVFGVHCVAGIIGTMAVALLAHPRLGGTGIVDFLIRPGQSVITTFDPLTQLFVQLKMLVVTVTWSGLVTVGSLKLVDRLVGVRTDPSDETRGLDITDHGERAYNT
jgi:ammonium transporter, Amt family